MINTQFTRKALRGGAALQAMALLGAGLATSALLSAPAAAQDYTSGAIAGTVTDETGATVSGATVTVTSIGQGFERTATSSSSGAFRFNGLTQGTYNVVVTAAGRPTYRADAVPVQASQTSTLSVELASAGGEDIVVTGSRAVADFTGTTTGVNVDVADLVKTTPINRDLTSVVLLAPGTKLGDDGFGNLASINGASVAENAYYINGLNVTNFDNYLGGSEVPFEFYRNIETKTGGIPAEFGRATGGIINAVSKSGSNEFTAALHVNWIPQFLRSVGRNLQSCDEDGVCTQTTNRGFSDVSSLSAIMEAGGPVIRDKLFVYGLVEMRRTRSLTANPTTNLAFDQRSDDPFYAIKVDAYPIDSQHLEFTLFDTRRTTRQSNLEYSVLNGEGVTGAATSVTDYKRGGVNFVGKYTGTFADWLTVSAAYGRSRDRFDQEGIDAGSSGYYFANSSGAAIGSVPSGGLFTGQGSSSREFPYSTEREFYRADADVFFNLLGDHHIRGGFEVENLELQHNTVRTGGDALLAAGFISQEAYDAGNGGAGFALIARPGNIVELNYYNAGGAFGGKNKAFYVQDEWKPFEQLTLNLGVRRDDFRIDKPGGEGFVNLKENYAPRLGFEFSPFESNRGKFFGSYSWYYLPVATNTAYRNAGQEFYFRERFNYSGIGANGLPILTTQVTDNGTYQIPCPFGLTPQSSGQNCNVTSSGVVNSSASFLSSNLKPSRDSEIILGYNQRVSDVTVGLIYTRRRVDRLTEDVAVDQAVLAYCRENGITGCEDTWTGTHQYSLINPGSDAVVALAGLDGQTVTLPAANLGYPKGVRKYDAVTLQVDRPFDGTWSLGGSYTWSKSRGNSEGFVSSDFEQDDAGATQDFDQPGFIPGAYGYLPNDRRHVIKLYGGYAVTEAFTFGANVQVESARPLSCIGWNPTDAFANKYGAASHYCGGVLSPRGTAQKTQWIEQINLSGRYNARFGDRVVTLRADVFNLLNSQGITGRNETGDLDVTTGADGLPATYIANPNYGQVTSYQTPRYVRVGFDIAF